MIVAGAEAECMVPVAVAHKAVAVAAAQLETEGERQETPPLAVGPARCCGPCLQKGHWGRWDHSLQEDHEARRHRCHWGGLKFMGARNCCYLFYTFVEVWLSGRNFEIEQFKQH